MSQILIIEPDHILAGLYRQSLEMAGHKVQICAGAQSAIFCVDEFLPDIVILELQLVGHSGLEFLYEFRSYAEWQTIPTIIMTNVPPDEFAGCWQLLTNQLGVAAYHYKPHTSLKTLARSVEQLATIPA
ncbi:MAG TPA: response regulator [Candidatus Dormibacteraeota bacterium]|nr:response regulator [Candidatus Dormibacteraeota bacterium]